MPDPKEQDVSEPAGEQVSAPETPTREATEEELSGASGGVTRVIRITNARVNATALTTPVI